MTPPTAHMRLWSCVLTLANSSVITAPLYHPPLSPPRAPPPRPSSLGPEPTLPDGWAAARWAGWVGHLGARGSLNLPLPALLVTRLHPRVQLRAWLGQGDPQGAIDTRSGQGEGLGPLLLFLHPSLPPPHSLSQDPRQKLYAARAGVGGGRRKPTTHMRVYWGTYCHQGPSGNSVISPTL